MCHCLLLLWEPLQFCKDEQWALKLWPVVMEWNKIRWQQPCHKDTVLLIHYGDGLFCIEADRNVMRNGSESWALVVIGHHLSVNVSGISQGVVSASIRDSHMLQRRLIWQINSLEQLKDCCILVSLSVSEWFLANSSEVCHRTWHLDFCQTTKSVKDISIFIYELWLCVCFCVLLVLLVTFL